MPEFQPLFTEKKVEDNDKFRVIKLDIPGHVFYNYKFNHPLLLVNLKNVEFKINEFKMSQSWKWYEQGDELMIKNLTGEKLELIAIFLK